jgi:hypothetical protein
MLFHLMWQLGTRWPGGANISDGFTRQLYDVFEDAIAGGGLDLIPPVYPGAST